MAVTDPEQRWARLAEAAPKKDVSERDQCRWVSQYVGVSPDKIPVGSAPNKAAVALQRWANGAQTEFYRNVYSKILPSKAEIEKMDSVGASDAEIDGLLERIERTYKEANDERD